MKRLLFFILFLPCLYNSGNAQNTIIAVIRDAETKEPITGAMAFVSGTTIGGITNENGSVLLTNIPGGPHKIIYRYIGYSPHNDSIMFPRDLNDTLKIYLNPEHNEMDEVTISSTRNSRTFQNTATRIEFIGGEEIDEKANMKPGDIRMMLNESTGIQTQQTSATSGNSSIRIQGLDGRYTQVLKDGFPSFSGFSGGLGLLQTPPLDLKQVEVIKGSASTLYGGGAMAGLVNLISKTPQKEKELRFLINGTSARGLDADAFYSKRNDKYGTTIYASRNSSEAFDPAGTGFSAIPRYERYVLNPKLFLYFDGRNTLNIGLNMALEDRIGGDMKYIEGKGDNIHRYFEQNKTTRLGSQLVFEHKFTDSSKLTFKNSVNKLDRKIIIPAYTFDGGQWLTYSELAFAYKNAKTDWILGLNVQTDQFREKMTDTIPRRDYNQNTYGAFAQNTWTAAEWLIIESGLRGDYVSDYGFYLLPRVSALFKIAKDFTSRAGGGFGYKAPTIFSEESERIQYRGVLPIVPAENHLEKSYGANVDFNYRTTFFADKVSFSINQLFFYTKIENPMLLTRQADGLYKFISGEGHLDTRGLETNAKLGFGPFKLFFGYTFTDAELHTGNLKEENPLTAKHRINNVLMFEIENNWKLGAEAYYYSSQQLTDGTRSRPYWIFGFMAEKIWPKFSLYINFENFTDTRQTRFESIYTGPVSNPVFRDIYAPLDGFVINGGVKIRL